MTATLHDVEGEIETRTARAQLVLGLAKGIALDGFAADGLRQCLLRL